MTKPRFVIKTALDDAEFTRAEPSEYVQVIVEDEPASAVSLSGSALGKCFIFEVTPTSHSME
jgi:hypothetical protein